MRRIEVHFRRLCIILSTSLSLIKRSRMKAEADAISSAVNCLFVAFADSAVSYHLHQIEKKCIKCNSQFHNHPGFKIICRTDPGIHLGRVVGVPFPILPCPPLPRGFMHVDKFIKKKRRHFLLIPVCIILRLFVMINN